MLLKKISKYKTIYWVLIKNCLAAQLEFRLNFMFSILVEFGWVFSHLLYLIVIFKTDIIVNGLTQQAMLMFVGTYLFLTGVFMSLFFTNFSNMSEYIRTGQLDIYITKPVSLQFLTTMRYINFGYPIPDIVIGLSLIVIGWNNMNISVNVKNVLGFVLFLLCGIIWVYVLQIIPALCSFWTVKTSGIYSIAYSIHDMNKMPMGIYDKWIKKLGTYILPLFPMTNYPTLFVMGQLDTVQIVWGVFSPFLFLILVRLVWSKAVKRYTSASS